MSYFRADRARRQPPKIGFAWTFVLSLILTPIVGLIAALTSPKLPHGGEKWGFVHIGFMVLTALALISFLVVLFTGGIFFVAGGE